MTRTTTTTAALPPALAPACCASVSGDRKKELAMMLRETRSESPRAEAFHAIRVPAGPT